jgi:putative flavoprotein involved in K+ transport
MPLPHADTAREPLDVIVVGAGQAGLALGHHLAGTTDRFVLLEAASEVGHSWRSRWDSLRLFSPAQYDALPGMPFPGAHDSHPTKDEVADYLAAYAARFALPVLLDSPAHRVDHEPDGTFRVTTPGTVLHARQVVVATGPFQQPRIPDAARSLNPAVTQLHSSAYRNPRQVRGRVLVVGAANSGLQIADELADSCDVVLAVGSSPTELPQRLAGRDLFFWLVRSGFFTIPATSRVARRLRARGDLVIGTRRRDLRARGVDVRPRLTGFEGDVAHFLDGTSTIVDAVVWATGFRSDHSWLHVPGALDDAGSLRHERGVAPVRGLYAIGLPWQTSRGSALLGFVGADAAELADRMAEDRAREGRVSVGRPDDGVIAAGR